MGVDPLRNDPVKRNKRDAIHRHNGLSGSTRWALLKMRDIQRATTTTVEAKRASRRVEIELEVLLHELKTRNPGT